MAHMIDDKLYIANAKHLEHEKKLLKKHFKCDDIGKVKDCTGCKLDIAMDGWSQVMMEHVLMQSLSDEFEDILQGKAPLVPATPGNVLTKCKKSDKLTLSNTRTKLM
jgi:hypothetical protein